MSKKTNEQELRESLPKETQNLFYQDSEPTDDHDDVIIDEDEWEDVPLGGINVTIPRSKTAKSIKKKAKSYRYQKLKFGLHVTLIPFMLKLLRKRSKWVQDDRLNRRLRRSIPKIIKRRFSKWIQEKNFERIRTLLLGLVFWFRSHYQINCNGFRQNFNRLQYLIRYSNSEVKPKLYGDILENQHWFYGERPKFGGNIEDVRQMAKSKKSNRDILVIFFLIILRNLLCENVQINLCFAPPLHDYELESRNLKWQMNHGIGRVPDRFDTDLILPFFWIELRFKGRSNEFYIVDPVVQLKEEMIVARHSEDEPVTQFRPFMDMKTNVKQRFDYVVSINCENGVMADVSPRYLPNMYYRFFEPQTSSTVLQSLARKSYESFKKYLKIYTQRDPYHINLMKHVAAKHYVLPETLSEMKRSPCYIIPSLLKRNETLRSKSKQVATFREESVFLKCDVIILKSQQHWAQLGRSLKPNSRPLKSKKYIPMINRRERKLDIYEVKGMFSIEQTVPTPRLPGAYIDRTGQKCPITDVEFYKNKFNHVEIYSPDAVPHGFHLLPLEYKNDIRLFNRRRHKTGESKIKYLEVLSGFDFRKKPGYAMPNIENLLVNYVDYQRTVNLVQCSRQLTALQKWNDLLMKIKIQERLDSSYGRLN